MQLSTKRLVLRDACLQDSSSLELYQQDPRYLQYYFELPDAESIVKSSMKWAMEQPRVNYQFVVILAEYTLVIGCAGIRSKGCPIGSAEIGIEIAPEFWTLGYAHEAIAELISFARSQKIDRISASTHCENTKAHRLVEKFNFFQIGQTSDQIIFECILN